MTDSRGIRDDIPVPNEKLFHDDITLRKVMLALAEAGVDIRQANEAVRLMEANGILFREKEISE